MPSWAVSAVSRPLGTWKVRGHAGSHQALARITLAIQPRTGNEREPGEKGCGWWWAVLSDISALGSGLRRADM